MRLSLIFLETPVALIFYIPCTVEYTNRNLSTFPRGKKGQFSCYQKNCPCFYLPEVEHSLRRMGLLYLGNEWGLKKIIILILLRIINIQYEDYY
jgi:hypothetical protein